MNYTPATIETLKVYPLGKGGLKCETPLGIMELNVLSWSNRDGYDLWFKTSNDYFKQDYNYKILYKNNRIGSGFNSEEVRPILYPLSCLTEEIIVSNYNNGNPFIPIVEIAKQTCPWADEITSSECGYDETDAYSNILCGGVVVWSITFNGESFFCEIDEYRMMINQMKCFQLLQKFFINYQNLDAINPFDLEANPYRP